MRVQYPSHFRPTLWLPLGASAAKVVRRCRTKTVRRKLKFLVLTLCVPAAPHSRLQEARCAAKPKQNATHLLSRPRCSAYLPLQQARCAAKPIQNATHMLSCPRRPISSRLQEARRAADAARAAQEASELRNLRRALKPHARVMPDFSRPFMPRAPAQQLTRPETPSFGRKKQSARTRRGSGGGRGGGQ